MDLPLYFPKDYNRRLLGLHDRTKVKTFGIGFQDFGRYGNVDVDFPDSAAECPSSSRLQPVFVSQRHHERDLDRHQLCALAPTLPLSDTPVQVHYPFHDNVVGDLPLLPAKVSKFFKCLKWTSGQLKSARAKTEWAQAFLAAKKDLECSRARVRDTPLTPEHLDSLVKDLPPAVHRLLDQYPHLSQRAWLQFNPAYSGGLLSCVTDGSGMDTRHLLFHASGRDLDHLTVTQVSSSPDSRILPSRQLLVERQVEPVFQVQAQRCLNGGDIFVGVRHRDSCSVFSLPAAAVPCPDSAGVVDFESADDGGQSQYRDDTRYKEFEDNRDAPQVVFSNVGAHRTPHARPTSLCVSPYLPGEFLFCADDGTVSLWDAGRRGVTRTLHRRPRFPCDDPWHAAYYAAHPRQVVLVDPTAVQMVDHRNGYRTSLDLFALPNNALVSKRERVVAARHHGDDSSLHVVSTGRCLFVVDQRFPATPVLQWYPDQHGPAVYLASGDYVTRGGEGKGVVLAGSQHPAEVMCYPLSHGGGRAAAMPLNPWRLSRVSDVGDGQRYPCFLGDTDHSVFQERLGLSLAGLAVARGWEPESFVAYQLDCNGEVYFQQYSNPTDPRLARKTGVPAPGKRDQQVSPDVQGHVRSWARHLQDQVESQRNRELEPGVDFRVLTVRNVADNMQQPPPGPGLSCNNDDHLEAAATALPAELQREEVCGFCGDTAEDLSPLLSHTSRRGREILGRRLCSTCSLVQHNFTMGDRRSDNRRSDGLSSSADDTNRGHGDCVCVQSFSCDFESFLEGVTPAVESYGGGDAHTRLLVKLMKGESDLAVLVEEREKDRSQLLKERVEKNRKRKRKRQASAAEDDLDRTTDQNGGGIPQAEHSVFNSAEHHQQNTLIQQIMSDKASHLQKPTTISQDPADSDLASVSHFESDSDVSVMLPGREDGERVDGKMDQSWGSTQGLDEGVGFHNKTQDDDDDEFFSTPDITVALNRTASEGASPFLKSRIQRSETVNPKEIKSENDGFVKGRGKTKIVKSERSDYYSQSQSQADDDSFFSPTGVASFSRTTTPDIDQKPNMNSLDLFSEGESESEAASLFKVPGTTPVKKSVVNLSRSQNDDDDFFSSQSPEESFFPPFTSLQKESTKKEPDSDSDTPSDLDCTWSSSSSSFVTHSEHNLKSPRQPQRQGADVYATQHDLKSPRQPHKLPTDLYSTHSGGESESEAPSLFKVPGTMPAKRGVVNLSRSQNDDDDFFSSQSPEESFHPLFTSSQKESTQKPDTPSDLNDSSNSTHSSFSSSSSSFVRHSEHNLKSPGRPDKQGADFYATQRKLKSPRQPHTKPTDLYSAHSGSGLKSPRQPHKQPADAHSTHSGSPTQSHRLKHHTSKNMSLSPRSSSAKSPHSALNPAVSPLSDSQRFKTSQKPFLAAPTGTPPPRKTTIPASPVRNDSPMTPQKKMVPSSPMRRTDSPMITQKKMVPSSLVRRTDSPMIPQKKMVPSSPVRRTDSPIIPQKKMVPSSPERRTDSPMTTPKRSHAHSPSLTTDRSATTPTRKRLAVSGVDSPVTSPSMLQSGLGNTSAWLSVTGLVASPLADGKGSGKKGTPSKSGKKSRRSLLSGFC